MQALQHIALRSGSNGFKQFLVFVVHGEHDDARCGPLGSNQPGRLQAVADGHVDIHDDQRRLQIAPQCQSRQPIAGLPGHFQIGLSRDQPGQPFAEQFVIIR
jgi:hypothetical protein